MFLNMKEINLSIKNKIVNWNFYPFPHAIIDNFLPKEIFEEISAINLCTDDDLRRINTSGLEFNKKEYGLKGKSDLFRIPIEIMGHGEGKNLFSKFIEPKKIITLASFRDFGDYYPFHSSTKNGLLGSHIDHSCLGDNIHFANSIFYVHKTWKADWGGETILFSKNGLKPLVYIEPRPNRIILFIHSNTSFHGVNRILCPDNIKRNTYYMDYYLKNQDIKLLMNNVYKESSLSNKLSFTFHETTFIPFFPLGIGSKISLNFRRVLPYIFSYFIYLFFRVIPLEMQKAITLYKKINSFKQRLRKLIVKR